MKPVEDCTIGIVGLGLMGGAVAMALRSSGAAQAGHLLACDSSDEILAQALSAGLIDEGFTESSGMLKRCDLVYLCLNPSTLLRFMETRMADFKEGALITDIAGTKGRICAVMEKSLREDLDFIPGHPMAGAEKGGFANAGLVNFKGKNYILTPLKRNRPENLAYIKELIHRMGFGRITETTAAEHDSKIAFTSQLCHVIAAGLIDCEGDREITRFGGGSFEDLTRIAMLNVPMWTEIFLENRDELLKRIEQFEGSLDKLKTYISAGNENALRENLRLVRDRRLAMK
ncbi:MAG: prephenate dehydrogenase [Treponema sp.]|nr:prephenate dehydrogenase [Treponema sp.]